MEKPHTVKKGVICLWLSLALAAIKTVIVHIDTDSFMAQLVSRDSNLRNFISLQGGKLPDSAVHQLLIISVGTTLIILLIQIFFINRINDGKNWARLLVAISYLMSIFIFVPVMFQAYQSGDKAIFLPIDLAALVLNTIALIFLYLGPSNEWFSYRKAVKHA